MIVDDLKLYGKSDPEIVSLVHTVGLSLNISECNSGSRTVQQSNYSEAL